MGMDPAGERRSWKCLKRRCRRRESNPHGGGKPHGSLSLQRGRRGRIVMVFAWAPVADPAFVARLFTTDVWGITPVAMSLSGRG